MNTEAAGKVKRKRNRIPLSCTICRKRKVKCDKTHPHCNQCIKTGVHHLCHYMEQSWAGEVGKEMSRDLELKKLRDKVKALEELLSKVKQTEPLGKNVDINPDMCTPESVSLATSLTNNNGNVLAALDSTLNLSPDVLNNFQKYDNDELDLTIQFDMLHLKNKGTVHLGATHWLAVMKGDPYLKLLWSQLFIMREKLSEWYSQKKRLSKKKMDKMQQCPVMRRKLKNESNGLLNPIPTKCPVGHSKFKSNAITENDSFPRPMSGMNFPDSASHTSLLNLPLSKSPLPNFSQLSRSTTPINSGNIDGDISMSKIISNICDLLPPKSVISVYLDKFFRHIYPVIPIIDEQSFRLSLNRMLGLLQTDSDMVKTLKISKISDYCTLGILVIIMRLTWLSLSSNTCDIDLTSTFIISGAQLPTTINASKIKEESVIMQYEPSVETLRLIRKYLIKFDEISSFSNSNVSLITVQFAIFYKLYLKSCADASSTNTNQVEPMDSIGGQDNETHQVLMSSITQMAFSCGLHRDPDNFPQLNSITDSQSLTTNGSTNNLEAMVQASADMNGGTFNKTTSQNNSNNSNNSKEAQASTERYKHTWRKTWYYIVSMDVEQSLSLGTPRLLRTIRDISDTKLPSASKIDYVKDIKELIVVKNYSLFFQIDLVIISVLNHILNVSVAKNVKKSDLDSLINSLKDLTHNNKPINDVINDLMNKGLLSESEGVVDQNADESYGLPSLEDLAYPERMKPDLDGNISNLDKKIELPHESTTKALLFSKHLTVRVLLFLLNYILFTHYEPLASEDPETINVAKNYAQSALDYAMDGFKNCVFFFTSLKNSKSTDSLFNYMEVMLTTHCLDVGNRGLQYIICLILRSKCGPLSGMGDTTVMATKSSSASSTTSGSGENSCSENEEDFDPNSLKKKGAMNEIVDFDKRIDLEADDDLSKLLYARIALFYELTDQISHKYKFASKLNKSVKFFMSLLQHPLNKMSTDGKPSSLLMSGWKHPRINNMPKNFKNSTQFILSADTEQLKRCPVYQDTVGYMGSVPDISVGRNTGFYSNNGMQQSRQLKIQLPSLRAYNPVTYNKSNIREVETDESIEQFKKRRLENVNEEEHIIGDILDPVQQGPPSFLTSRNNLVQRDLKTFNRVNSSADLLPPLENVTRSLTPINDLSVFSDGSNFSSMVKSEDNTVNNDLVNLISPASVTSSDSQNIPDFEDFLLQDTNFNNGLQIDPSSLCEAVGIRNIDQLDMNLVGMYSSDFLPIDNIGSTNLQGINGGDYSVWN
ncbi:hypothetical protein Kpol_1061p26 [Vanderwaltozyma polyspora DSM 70294]|uniref:Zn(2)-C6 fungal-type domain-containing protein n=1 Tax=Vanderwaltozyma polyspora (strain ATCC 22028 / DSM 70294 / BCRC 21397 / CBS 2163 / NBRC 10782 / NRRL Y-8283 / UCD 57-17) TaxID=436907 RepID=A7TJF2_VANPO|nr:uncharacterized protein Kpol_1061p26 [Vanderwaltozyma polyspora DSM 70294]EDO17602.1 hypothetical protein Kpol_1061p26 [Vanderwaltozyma polyspora DSM 70294]